MLMRKRSLLISALIMLFFAAVFCSAMIDQEKKDNRPPEKAKNLKILPPDISHDELINVMKSFSKSLGVRCTTCHVGTEGDRNSFDFAADTKKEKLIARKMMKMVTGINKKYIGKMGEPDFEKITCVTCHMGNIKPLVNVDSLQKK